MPAGLLVNISNKSFSAYINHPYLKVISISDFLTFEKKWIRGGNGLFEIVKLSTLYGRKRSLDQAFQCLIFLPSELAVPAQLLCAGAYRRPHRCSNHVRSGGKHGCPLWCTGKSLLVTVPRNDINHCSNYHNHPKHC